MALVDARSILAAASEPPNPQRPVRRWCWRCRSCRRSLRLRDRRPVMTATTPVLAPDFAEGLRRLKLAAMRRLAPSSS